MCETKARNELGSDEVKAKASAGRKWCGYATDYARAIGGKPWEYLLIPHDEVKDDRSLGYLQVVGKQDASGR